MSPAETRDRATAKATTTTRATTTTGNPLPGPPIALYVHVPFCLSVCPYCDFVVFGGAAARGPRSRVAPFLRALHVEVGLRADVLDDQWGSDRPALTSVYLGGGTPSLLPADAVAGLLDLVADRFGIARGAEITLEANPGTADRGDLAGFAAAGVTRVSFGVQSFDAAELRRLGRRHAPEDVAEAVRLSRVAGIGSVNLDLLLDLPGRGAGTWAATLEAALELKPDHLSLYALSLDDPDAEGLAGPNGDHLPVSRGARRWREQARREQDEDRAADEYRLAVVRLAAAGFRGYEISNWAIPGHECRHNLGYWLRRPYEAIGPGAHAFDGLERRWNAAWLDGYLDALLPGSPAAARLPPGGSETVDDAGAAVERVVLGLRLDAGLPADEAGSGPLAAHLDWALGNGLLDVRAGRVALTTAGRLLSNELLARIV